MNLPPSSTLQSLPPPWLLHGHVGISAWSLQWCYAALRSNLVRAKEAQQTQSQSDTVTGSEAAATGRDSGGRSRRPRDGMETTDPVVGV
ncbi:hypothetical protein K449DRAFT_428219 [Hypoxylon sp. EC38]|nr:hypothetical protein K449DRAFT_428219 [Hypoxylon sp. EC38]